MPDYYAVLDLPPTATSEQIDARYRQFVRMFDPTLYDEPAELAYVRKKLKAVEKAYLALRRQSARVERWQTAPLSDVVAPPSTPTIHHRQIDFTDDANSALQAAPRPHHAEKGASVRWLQKFLFTSATIIVAALAGTAMLEQGLGVLAYVTALQQNRSIPVMQVKIDAISPVTKNDTLSIYSVDQKQVAFVADIMGKHQVFLKNPKTDKVHQLSYAASLQSLPLWSPQADQLAFLDNSAGNPIIQIFVLATQQLYTFQPPATLGQVGRIAWNADGATLLFESYGPKAPAEITLWQIDNTGRNMEHFSKPAPSGVIWSKPLP